MYAATRALQQTLLTVLLIAMTPAPHADAVTGMSAEQAQLRLRAYHCDPGPADGTVGSRTRAALIRFQAANDLAQTGNLNDVTSKRLAREGSVDCQDRPVPLRSGTGRRIVISQTQNYLWLIRHDGSVLRQAPLVDNPEVLAPGTWFSGSKCGRPARVRYNSDYSGSLRLDYFSRFAPCGIGFHRIPVRKSTGLQVHADWKLGTNIETSHGCIRLSNATARAVYEFTAGTTKVVVLR